MPRNVGSKEDLISKNIQTEMTDGKLLLLDISNKSLKNKNLKAETVHQ